MDRTTFFLGRFSSFSSPFSPSTPLCCYCWTQGHLWPWGRMGAQLFTTMLYIYIYITTFPRQFAGPVFLVMRLALWPWGRKLFQVLPVVISSRSGSVRAHQQPPPPPPLPPPRRIHTHTHTPPPISTDACPDA